MQPSLHQLHVQTTSGKGCHVKAKASVLELKEKEKKSTSKTLRREHANAAGYAKAAFTTTTAAEHDSGI